LEFFSLDGPSKRKIKAKAKKSKNQKKIPIAPGFKKKDNQNKGPNFLGQKVR